MVRRYDGSSAGARWASIRGGGILVLGLALVGTGGCGKKGPPLPPLVRLPEAPSAVKAERRGSTVEVRLVVPAQNTDGSRPADVQRVDVYAWDGPADTPPAEVVRRGTRVRSVVVKAPRDPDQTVSADDPLSDVEAPGGPGLDQGATAYVRDPLPDPSAMVDTPSTTIATERAEARSRTRSYVGVAITTRGRRGPLSSPAVIPLSPAPAAPGEPSLTYDETGVTLGWTPAPEASEADAPLITASAVPALTYHVYDVTPAADPIAAAETGSDRIDVRLTETAVAKTAFVDRRIVWGRERCYAVRALRTVEALTVEGDATPRACVTPVDTFAPQPPTGLTAVASAGAISLIWNPSGERDLAGYHVLRGDAPSAELVALTPSTIVETTYTDQVPGGKRFVYAVRAVDTAGNAGRPSTPVEEAAQEVTPPR